MHENERLALAIRQPIDALPETALQLFLFDRIRAATSSHVVGRQIAPGVYLEHDIDFLGKVVTVRGSGAAGCVVDAGGQGRAFVFRSGEGPSSPLEGFTLTNGVAPGDGGGALVDG